MAEMLKEICRDEADTQHGRFLTFYLGKEVFGIEISYVTQIIGLQKIDRLPDSPDYVKGIINFRGKIIPVIDMCLRLKEKSKPYTDRTCIIVTDIMDAAVGFIVDMVDEVVTIADESIVPPPRLGTGFHSGFIKGIGRDGDSIRLLLDCKQLFHAEEIETFKKIER